MYNMYSVYSMNNMYNLYTIYIEQYTNIYIHTVSKYYLYRQPNDSDTYLDIDR